MSRWDRDSRERVETAITIRRHGEVDKTVLELVREL